MKFRCSGLARNVSPVARERRHELGVYASKLNHICTLHGGVTNISIRKSINTRNRQLSTNIPSGSHNEGWSVGIKLIPGLPYGDFGKIVREPIEANVVLRQNIAVV